MLVHDFLTHSASRLPDKVALICGDQRLTYREINLASDRLAAGLRHLGLKRGERVVILLDSSPEAVIGLFGVLKAGGVFVMLHPAVKARKLNYSLRDCGARVLITHGNKAAVFRGALPDCPELRHVIRVGREPSLPGELLNAASCFSWDDLFTSSGPLSFEPSPLSSQHFPICIDLAALLYTSGSTGEPKGVMCAHCNMVSVTESIAGYLGNTEEDVILNVLPLSFGYGLYQILTAFFVGAAVVLEKSFAYPYRVLERLVEQKATGFPLVPTMASVLLKIDRLATLDLSSLKYITNAAAALPVAHIRRLRQLLPHVKIYSMYGLTECTRASYLPPEEIDGRPDSVGVPIPNEEVFVVDERGKEVGPNAVGELVVRGSNVMQGYWNAPEETARVFRKGAYRGDCLLYTGDLFRRDAEGFLYFVARKDDLIKTKGERVSPREIETVLCEMEGIVEAAVTGVPDDLLGEAIKAYVVVREERGVTEKDVARHCAEHLEPFMAPKYVEFRDFLPKTPNGKIDKKRLIG